MSKLEKRTDTYTIHFRITKKITLRKILKPGEDQEKVQEDEFLGFVQEERG